MERLSQQKQKVQAEAIRNLPKDEKTIYAVALNQGWMDGINFVISEPQRTITRLTNQGGDQER